MADGRATDSRAQRVRVLPGGPWTVVAAATVWACALAALSVCVVLLQWTSAALPTVAALVPSLLLIAVGTRLTTRAAAGFVLDGVGLHSAAQRRRFVRWDVITGLRWGRTKRWGRGNHQLLADLRNGQTIVVWGCRGPRSHDRIVAGLHRANGAALVPPWVAQGVDLDQPWTVVAARLDHAAAASPAR